MERDWPSMTSARVARSMLPFSSCDDDKRPIRDR